jgi:hypothetical protein
MSSNTLEHRSDSQVEAKIEHSPPEALPGFVLVVLDGDGNCRREIDLSRYDLREWIPVTDVCSAFDRGTVEARLVRTQGSGSWSATLRLRANPGHGTREAIGTASGEDDVLALNALFRRKP